MKWYDWRLVAAILLSFQLDCYSFTDGISEADINDSTLIVTANLISRKAGAISIQIDESAKGSSSSRAQMTIQLSEKTERYFISPSNPNNIRLLLLLKENKSNGVYTLTSDFSWIKLTDKVSSNPTHHDIEIRDLLSQEIKKLLQVYSQRLEGRETNKIDDFELLNLIRSLNTIHAIKLAESADFQQELKKLSKTHDDRINSFALKVRLSVGDKDALNEILERIDSLSEEDLEQNNFAAILDEYAKSLNPEEDLNEIISVFNGDYPEKLKLALVRHIRSQGINEDFVPVMVSLLNSDDILMQYNVLKALLEFYEPDTRNAGLKFPLLNGFKKHGPSVYILPFLVWLEAQNFDYLDNSTTKNIREKLPEIDNSNVDSSNTKETHVVEVIDAEKDESDHKPDQERSSIYLLWVVLPLIAFLIIAGLIYKRT